MAQRRFLTISQTAELLQIERDSLMMSALNSVILGPTACYQHLIVAVGGTSVLKKCDRGSP